MSASVRPEYSEVADLAKESFRLASQVEILLLKAMKEFRTVADSVFVESFGDVVRGQSTGQR